MKLYVGNLTDDFTEDDLKNLFANLGEIISAKIIVDRTTGASRGFGFVEMQNEEDGQKAIDELNGKEIREGHALVVNKARPPVKRDRRFSGNRSGGGGGGNRGGGGRW